jgi:hypothetical protein
MRCIVGLSFNQPKFCPTVTWQPNGITLANSRIIGNMVIGMFIDTNNNIYLADVDKNHVLVWSEGSITPTRIISGNLTKPVGIFVTSNGDIYIDNVVGSGRVERWSINSTSGVPVMYASTSCYALFIDANDTLYCSAQQQNQVIKTSLNATPYTVDIAAGTDIPGNESNMLNRPYGIFVDINFNLYVADSENHRIQLFKPGQTDGETIAGAPRNFSLNYPTSIIVDADGYLFIVDRLNHRIVRSGPNGYHCVIGCSGTPGAASNQLHEPFTIAFDHFGNAFVIDHINHRIQKFIVERNSCSKYNERQEYFLSKFSGLVFCKVSLS